MRCEYCRIAWRPPSPRADAADSSSRATRSAPARIAFGSGPLGPGVWIAVITNVGVKPKAVSYAETRGPNSLSRPRADPDGENSARRINAPDDGSAAGDGVENGHACRDRHAHEDGRERHAELQQECADDPGRRDEEQRHFVGI